MYRKIIFPGILLLMFTSFTFAADRNVAVDQTVGGMEQGRRIQAPGSYSNKGVASGQPGSTTGSATDRHTVLQESEKATTDSRSKNISEGNHGFLYQAGREQENNSSTTRTSTESSGQSSQLSTGQDNGSTSAGSGQANLPSGQTETGQPNGSTNVTAGESSTENTNGSVNVNRGETSSGQSGGSVNVNPEIPTGQTGSTEQTSLPAEQTGQTVSEQVNNPLNSGTGSVTTEINTGTGSSTETSTGSTNTQESSGTSNNPIIDADANVNPESGEVDADVQTDTSGQLEDRQIIDAGATTGQTSTQTGTGSTTEISGSETVHETDVTTQPVDEVTGHTPTGTGSTESSTEQSGSSTNPIVGVDANVNPESGEVGADVETDTSGELEDRQIIDAGATAGQTTTHTETGSATEITGSETVHQTDITTQPVTELTGQTGDTTTGVEAGNVGILVGGETSPTGQIGTEESTASPQTTEESNPSSNPIVDVDANINPESGAVDADVQTDTSGELEDRQIIDAGATTGETSTQTQTGSATEITGSETVHETDITTQPVTEATGQTGDTTTSVETGNGGILVGGEASPTGQIGSGETNTGGSQTTEESSSPSNNPIVDVDANINPESGAVDADVQTDTSGELEDRQIIDAGATAGQTSTQTETESATQITGSETVHQVDLTTQPVSDTTGQTAPGTTSVETQGNGGVLAGGETTPTGQVETGEISTGTGSSSEISEEPTSDSNNPIVGVDAEVSPESGTIEADTTIDTSGELEERQILDADLTGETTGSVGAEIGSAVDITAADLVEESDITTELVTETIGQLDAQQTGGSGTGETSGTSNDAIVDSTTNINPESGTADASVDLDMSGEIEDRQILELDLVAEDVGTTMADIDSASDITGSETIESADITMEPVESLIPAPADVVAEIDTTGQTVGGEVDTGIAADVEGMSEGEDVVSDPAGGLGL